MEIKSLLLEPYEIRPFLEGKEVAIDAMLTAQITKVLKRHRRREVSEAKPREQIAHKLWWEEYNEAIYYAELGSPTKGKAAIDRLVARIQCQYEPVQLEVLGDVDIENIYALSFHKPTKEEIVRYRAVTQATIAYNEAKGQLYRAKK